MSWRFTLPVVVILVTGLLVVIGYVNPWISAADSRHFGDVDCNGEVGSIDALLILQLDAVLISDLDCGDAADVSHDGRTNAVDAALILQVTAGLLESFGKRPSAVTPDLTVTPPPTSMQVTTATLTRTMTPPGVATPTATPAPECSSWPPEVAAFLERLPVVEGLCLVRLSDESEVPPNRGPCNPGCYYADLRQVWCIAPCDPPDVDGGETALLVSEVCHAHQHRMVLDANVPFDENYGWGVEDSIGLTYLQETNEGRSFIELGAWRFDNGEWIEEFEMGWSSYPNPYEDAASTCAIWYWNREYLPDYAPIRYEWAQMWLPE